MHKTASTASTIYPMSDKKTLSAGEICYKIYYKYIKLLNASLFILEASCGVLQMATII